MQRMIEHLAEDFADLYLMKRFRSSAFTAATSEKFDKYIFGLLGYTPEQVKERYKDFRKPFFKNSNYFEDINWQHYEKRREMLLKLAPELPGPM